MNSFLHEFPTSQSFNTTRHLLFPEHLWLTAVWQWCEIPSFPVFSWRSWWTMSSFQRMWATASSPGWGSSVSGLMSPSNICPHFKPGLMYWNYPLFPRPISSTFMWTTAKTNPTPVSLSWSMLAASLTWVKAGLDRFQTNLWAKFDIFKCFCSNWSRHRQHLLVWFDCSWCSVGDSTLSEIGYRIDTLLFP